MQLKTASSAALTWRAPLLNLIQDIGLWQVLQQVLGRDVDLAPSARFARCARCARNTGGVEGAYRTRPSPRSGSPRSGSPRPGHLRTCRENPARFGGARGARGARGTPGAWRGGR
eukprot:scaffold24005_cov59-Phaeocystis_antarctica.AAC.1